MLKCYLINLFMKNLIDFPTCCRRTGSRIPLSQKVKRLTISIATPPWKDEVTVLNTSCFGREIPLTSNSPNVETSVSRNPDGSYHHVFKWNNQPCIPACVVDFRVLSGAGNSAGGNAIEIESAQYSFSISVCGKPYIPGQ